MNSVLGGGASMATTGATSAVLAVIAIILALSATVLAFIFIIPEKKREKLKGILRLFHDIFNFKFMIIEKIFQFLYVFATAYIIIEGFFELFSFDWYGNWVGYTGFLTMILGPIAIRIVYELVMLALIAVKNIIQINNKLKNQNEDVKDDSTFAMPDFKDYKEEEPVAPQAAPQVATFCSKCGAHLAEDGTCPYCK